MIFFFLPIPKPTPHSTPTYSEKNVLSQISHIFFFFCSFPSLFTHIPVDEDKFFVMFSLLASLLLLLFLKLIYFISLFLMFLLFPPLRVEMGFKRRKSKTNRNCSLGFPDNYSTRKRIQFHKIVQKLGVVKTQIDV